MSFNAYPEPTARPQPVLYRVSIATAIGSGAAVTEGFIDHRSTRYYGTQSENYPTTLELARTKERSNMRYEAMVNNLSEHISPVIYDHTTTADANTIGGPYSFVLSYDRPEYIYTWNGATRVTDPILAIKRQIAKAFADSYTSNRGLFIPAANPVPRTEGMENITVASFGAVADLLTYITVTQIDLTP